ncbi:MAG: extensin [Alphaproteobacteria bacterium]|nr:extensin [Alphaproteobacteria bacterium]
MSRGVRRYLTGLLLLVALAGCGRSVFQYVQREPWRRDAEVACLNSGTVRENAGLVRISPIEGPGVCGAAFPLKVASLGESSALGFAGDAIRPPGSIPGAGSAAPRPTAQPRWPIAEPVYRAPQPAPTYAPPQQAGAPMSIHPPGVEPHASMPEVYYPQQQRAAAPPDYRPSTPNYGRPQPRRGALREEDDVDDDPPPRTRAPAQQSFPPAQQRPLPALGPQRNPRLAAATPIEIKPAATLACPIVSALDRWMAHAVQPAANKWFGQPVAEIRQISAYSCRGMNGQPGARISEHAFGNALDIAAFVLADGRRITVKDGWRGTPEEQGFLRDIQGAACDQFTTVLAPGSNQFHYDHIHVDLMRRESGRRICNPGAVDGDLIAAQARRNRSLAARQAPQPTRRYDPPASDRDDPFAWRGDARRGDVTGSIGPRAASRNPAADDNDWVEEPGPRPKIDWSGDRHKSH